MTKQIEKSVPLPIYIKFKDGAMELQEDMGQPSALVEAGLAGYSATKPIEGVDKPITHYLSLPVKSETGKVEIAQFEGKQTKITNNEAPFVYESCGQCGGTPPVAQGRENAVSCPHCQQTIIGKQLSKELVGQEILLIKPEYDIIDPVYKNVGRAETLRDDEKTKNANIRNGVGCFGWLIALTSLGVGGSGIVHELSKTTAMLQDIHYIYNSQEYYIPTSSLSESLGIGNLICLAPLVIAGIATLIRFVKNNQPEWPNELIEVLKNTPEDMREVNIYHLTDEQYKDPTVLVNIELAE